MRRQSGQVLILLALAMVILAGMLGLVIDGGVAADQKQVGQSAADASALAAGYTIETNPSDTTFDAANQAGATIITSDGLATTSLALTYWQSDHVTKATSPTTATYVRSTVTFATPTFFLRVLGTNSFSLTSTAEVTLHRNQAGGAVTGLTLTK